MIRIHQWRRCLYVILRIGCAARYMTIGRTFGRTFIYTMGCKFTRNIVSSCTGISWQAPLKYHINWVRFSFQKEQISGFCSLLTNYNIKNYKILYIYLCRTCTKMEKMSHTHPTLGYIKISLLLSKPSQCPEESFKNPITNNYVHSWVESNSECP